MEYKHEYISDELSELLEFMLSYDTCTSIYEEYHIVKIIEKCANELKNLIYKQYVNLTRFERINETYFDTDWYIKSHLENNVKIDDTFLTKVPTNHRIRFSFQKMNSSIEMQNIMRNIPSTYYIDEETRKKLFDENIETDNPVILIQPAFMDTFVNKPQEYSIDVLGAILSHEIRHVVDQYILEEQNVLLTKKNSLNSDFKNNNIFDLDVRSELYNKIKALIFCLSKEEQNGRFQGFYSLCNNIKRDYHFLTQLTMSYNRVQSVRYTDNFKPSIMDKNFRGEIISLLRINPFRYVHQLHTFRDAMSNMFNPKRRENYKITLVVGYFMFKHNYFNSGSIKSSMKELKKFFSYNNIKQKLSEPLDNRDEKFYYDVWLAVHKNYQRYENIIYNTLGMRIEYLYGQTKGGENDVIKFNKLAADNDLRLTDQQVGLITESYNMYLYYKERWLNGYPMWI